MRRVLPPSPAIVFFLFLALWHTDAAASGSGSDLTSVTCGHNTTGNASCDVEASRTTMAEDVRRRRWLVVIGLSVVAFFSDLICVAVWLEKYSTASEFFLLMISAYDLAHSVFKVMVALVRMHRRQFKHAIVGTAVLANLNGLTFHGMTFSYVALVAERHLALSKAYRLQKRMHLAKRYSIFVLVLLVSLAVPNTVMFALYDEDNTFTYFYHRTVIIAFRLVPWVFIMIFNGILLRDVKRQRRRMEVGFLRSAGTGITFCITIQTVASILTYPVAQIWRLTYLLMGSKTDEPIFYIVFILQLQHHVVNLLVYIALIKKFRLALCNCLRRVLPFKLPVLERTRQTTVLERTNHTFSLQSTNLSTRPTLHSLSGEKGSV